MVLSGRSSKTTTQRKLRFSPQQPTAPPSLGLAGADVCSLLTWCLPVLSFHFGKVDATPGRLSICAFLHGRAATSQPWTSREILALIPASLWPFGPIPGQCSHGPPIPPMVPAALLLQSCPLLCAPLHLWSQVFFYSWLPRVAWSWGLPSHVSPMPPEVLGRLHVAAMWLGPQKVPLIPGTFLEGQAQSKRRTLASAVSQTWAHSALEETMLARWWTLLANTLGMFTRCEVLPNHSFPVSI